MDPQDALAGAIAAIEGHSPGAPADIDADTRLQWDGLGWALLPEGTPPPTNSRGDLIPPKAIAVGWYIASRSLRRVGDDERRGGICVDIFDVLDPATSELIRHYACVEAWRRHIYRLDILDSDVRRAMPADARTAAEILSDIHTACIPKNHRLRAGVDVGWLHTTVIPVLAKVGQ